jgi:pimeloyl-ACP methyl ester carboxylesterase
MVAMPEVPQVRHRRLAVNGVGLHVAEAGPEHAPVVVLLHGFPQHWYTWRALITALAPTHRVLAIDLRGFGWSDAPRHGYSTDDRVRDVLAVLDELAIPHADLVGHDWGGWVAFRMALEHPGRVRRLVAVSVPHPWPMQRYLVPRVWRWWMTALFELPLLGERVLRHHPRVTSWLLARDARSPEVWTPALREIYTAPAAEPARASAGRRLHSQLVVHDIPRLVLGRDRRRRFDVPTLLVVGDHDALLPVAVLRVPRDRAGTIAVRVVTGGHFVVDENPDAITAAVLAHLVDSAEQTAPRPAPPRAAVTVGQGWRCSRNQSRAGTMEASKPLT